jgi:hypothetical protein
MSDPQREQPKKKRRTGSEKRKRYAQNTFRSTVEERAEMKANAAAVGLTFGSFMRILACARPTTRAMPHPLPELKPYTQGMGKFNICASNFHQLLRRVNLGEMVDVPELRDAAAKVERCAAELLQIIRGYSGDR